MILLNIIQALLPGDEDLKSPCFSIKMYRDLNVIMPSLGMVEKYFDDFCRRQPPAECSLAMGISFMAYLKGVSAEHFSLFRFAMLEAYMKSDDQGVARMGALYFNDQSVVLPDIDFDLLESVLDRGVIWRAPKIA